MKAVQFFHKRLVVKGNAEIIKFRDGNYRFWEVRTKKGEGCIVFREMVGVVTIQQRLDYWLAKEARLMPTGALSMVHADHIAPASIAAIKTWCNGHPKQMRKFDIRLNYKGPR